MLACGQTEDAGTWHLDRDLGCEGREGHGGGAGAVVADEEGTGFRIAGWGQVGVVEGRGGGGLVGEVEFLGEEGGPGDRGEVGGGRGVRGGRAEGVDAVGRAGGGVRG